MADWCVLSESQYKTLSQLVVQGHIDDLKKILSDCSNQQKAKITPETLLPFSSDHTSLFVLAAQHGHSEIVKYLIDILPYQRFLDHCSTVFDIANPGDELHHVTALNAACIRSNLPIVDFLLKNNASHTIPDCTGATPLNEAAYHGRVDVIKLLCQHGVNLHVPNDYGWEPLHVAAFKNHKKVFDCLVQSGADTDRVTADGLSVLHVAAGRGHVGMVKEILRQNVKLDPFENTNMKGEYIPSPLCLAAAYGYQSIVKLFCRLPHCTLLHMIDSQLLLGTSDLMKQDYQSTSAIWKQAIKLREESNPDSPLIPHEYFEGQSEIKNMKDLVELLGPGNPYRQANMWYQALMVWERCIGFQDISYWNMLANAADVLRRLQKFQEVEVMLIRGTELADMYLIPQLTEGHILPQNFEVFYQTWIQNALLYEFLDDSNVLQIANVGPNIQHIPNFTAYLPHVFNAIDAIVSRFNTLTNIYGCEKRVPRHLLENILQLFLVWLYLIDIQHPKIPAQAIDECCQCGMEFVSKFVVLADGNSLVHFLLDCQLPNLNMLLDSLLQWGGDKALNMRCKGLTCLHKAASLKQCSTKTIEILLDYGAHCDALDDQGQSFLDILKVTHSQMQADFNFGGRVQVPPPLYCLTAVSVINFGLPYQHIEYLPSVVKSFLRMHDRHD